MSIPVRYSLKVTRLHEDDVEPVRAAMTAHLKASGWYPSVQHIKTLWEAECTLWFATDWDDPPVRHDAARAIGELDAELRRLAVTVAALTAPEFEAIINLPQQD